MQQTILNLCKQFGLNSTLISYKLIKTGHINTTIQVVFLQNDKRNKYILQKINKYVFKNPQEIMENICNVTTFIKRKLKKQGKKTKRNVLKFYLASDGKSYIVDEFGEYWRMYKYVDNSVAFNNTDDLNVIEDVGRAFGEFQALLKDFPIDDLNLTIPDFHNVPKRYEFFKKVVVADEYKRVQYVLPEINELLKLEEIASQMQYMQEKGELKTRVTHNDTKCNNVLFDKVTNRYLCVIDLDTVMPGLVGSDFGDAIRYIANTCAEDEKNANKVKLDLKKYKAFSKGFLSKTGNNLSKEEINTLALGAITITTECALRFLTDYLDGDKYFKIDYAEHNLVRARCQLALAKNMIKNYTLMQNIINDCTNSNELQR